MPEYCIECGNELPDRAKFCNECGTKVDVKKIEGIEEKEQFQEIPIESSPALLDFRTALSILDDVKNQLDNTGIIDRDFGKGLEKKLDDIENLIDNIKSVDPDLILIDQNSNFKITIDSLYSRACFLKGEIAYRYAVETLQRKPNTQKLILNRAQENFELSYQKEPSDCTLYNIAFCIYERAKGIGFSKGSDYIKGINGEKVYCHPLNKKKAIQLAYNAFQKVIDTYPYSDFAVEARKMQSHM